MPRNRLFESFIKADSDSKVDLFHKVLMYLPIISQSSNIDEVLDYES
jgi:hypothetical protein